MADYTMHKQHTGLAEIRCDGQFIGTVSAIESHGRPTGQWIYSLDGKAVWKYHYSAKAAAESLVAKHRKQPHVGGTYRFAIIRNAALEKVEINAANVKEAEAMAAEMSDGKQRATLLIKVKAGKARCPFPTSPK